jgi:hypothetical protein
MEFGAPVGPENYAEALNRIKVIVTLHYLYSVFYLSLTVRTCTDSKWIMDLLDGKTNGAVDLADRPVPTDNMARLLGEADSFEGPTFTDLKELHEQLKWRYPIWDLAREMESGFETISAGTVIVLLCRGRYDVVAGDLQSDRNTRL